jgi:hypothetical protein
LSYFLMTPEQHRARAAELRRHDSAEALAAARAHDIAAAAIRRRLERGLET